MYNERSTAERVNPTSVIVVANFRRLVDQAIEVKNEGEFKKLVEAYGTYLGEVEITNKKMDILIEDKQNIQNALVLGEGHWYDKAAKKRKEL